MSTPRYATAALSHKAPRAGLQHAPTQSTRVAHCTCAAHHCCPPLVVPCACPLKGVQFLPVSSAAQEGTMASVYAIFWHATTSTGPAPPAWAWLAHVPSGAPTPRPTERQRPTGRSLGLMEVEATAQLRPVACQVPKTSNTASSGSIVVWCRSAFVCVVRSCGNLCCICFCSPRLLYLSAPRVI